MARTIQPRTEARQSGFTLIELMIVIATLAIVTAIAVTSYRSSAVKTRRGSAAACLMEAAQFMERSYTINMTYAVGAFPALGCAAEQSEYYNFGFSGAPDADSYTLQATPINAQLSADTRCGTLTLDNLGVKTESGTGSVEDCW